MHQHRSQGFAVERGNNTQNWPLNRSMSLSLKKIMFLTVRYPLYGQYIDAIALCDASVMLLNCIMGPKHDQVSLENEFFAARLKFWIFVILGAEGAFRFFLLFKSCYTHPGGTFGRETFSSSGGGLRFRGGGRRPPPGSTPVLMCQRIGELKCRLQLSRMYASSWPISAKKMFNFNKDGLQDHC